MTTTDTLIISYLTGHDHATFNDLYHHAQHPASDVGEAIDRLEQRRIITRTKDAGIPDTWTLTTTPDTPVTPTPPTIAAGHLILDPDDHLHAAWLTRELIRADGRDPSLMDSYRFEEDVAVVAEALRAMRGHQPAEDQASFVGEDRATEATVVDELRLRGEVNTMTQDPDVCGPDAPRTELRQPSLDVAKAVVDELEARMRDRLRAWGLQCEDDTSSDQETQP